MSQPIRGQGGHLVFSDRLKKHKLGRGRWDLAFCKVSLNSIQRFQSRSRKCESLRRTDGRQTDGRRTDGRTDDGRCAMTIAHLSLRLRWAKKVSWKTRFEYNFSWKTHFEYNFNCTVSQVPTLDCDLFLLWNLCFLRESMATQPILPHMKFICCTKHMNFIWNIYTIHTYLKTCVFHMNFLYVFHINYSYEKYM